MAVPPPQKSRLLVAFAVIAVVIGMLMWNSRQLERSPAAGPRQPVMSPAEEQVSTVVGEGEARPQTVRDPSVAPGTLDEGVAPGLPAAPSNNIPGTLPTTPLTAATPVAGLDLAAELDQVQMTLRDFRTVHGENPVGTNAEITRALMGDNLKQIKLPVPNGSRLNAAGELSDRWGTPYFFHQVSKTEMEVRSAGPDRTMWTNDDRQM